MRFLEFDLRGPTPNESTIGPRHNKLTEIGTLTRVMKTVECSRASGFHPGTNAFFHVGDDVGCYPTIADAVLDHVIHNAYRIALEGGSWRKQKAPTLLTSGENGETNWI